MTSSRTLGIIARHPYGFFFNMVLTGAESAARRHNARLVVIQGSPESVAEAQIAAHQVDGWIALTHLDGIEHVIEHGKPVITVGAMMPDLRCSAVVPDNRGGIEAAMAHLFDHGHERIGFVGWTAIGDIAERYTGYRSALDKRGLAFDESRVVITSGPLVDEGERAARHLITNGMPCTAIVVGTDMNAIGVIQALQTAGYRVPEDIAVVGFDDIPDAQSINPPLSTIRQRFDALGASAVEAILAEIDGNAVPGLLIHTPVMFVQRQSCGCRSTSVSAGLIQPERYTGADWRDHLARTLLEVMIYPLSAPDGSPAQVWPEVTILVDMLADALESHNTPDFGKLQAVWSSELALQANVEALHTVIDIVAQVAALRANTSDTAIPSMVHDLMMQMHMAVIRSSRNYQDSRVRYLEHMLTSTHRISLALLDENHPEAQQLNWLESTGIVWGCLGQWNDTHTEVSINQAYSQVHARIAQVGRRYSITDFPALELLDHGAQDELITCLVLPIQVAGRSWGFLALAGTIVPPELQLAESATDNLIMWAFQLAAMLERREMGESLLQSYQNERMLAGTVRELGSPVIPLINGVLLVPLIGALDPERAQQVIAAVLGGVTHYQANVVLLDLTAVPIVDTQVANALIQTAQATILLGAEVILVGIRPEIAQSIIGLGIDLGRIRSLPTLEVALQRLLSRWRVTG